jgi:hypothetical protein
VGYKEKEIFQVDYNMSLQGAFQRGSLKRDKLQTQNKSQINAVE